MRLAILLAACLAVAACDAPAPQFSPKAATASGDDATQQIVSRSARSGAPLILSAKPFSSVAIMQSNDPNVTQFGGAFYVRVVNEGTAPVSFGPERITVRQEGRTLALIGAEEANRIVQARNRTTQALGAATMLLGGLSSSLGSVSTSAVSALSQATTQMGMQVTQMAMASSANDARAFEDQASQTFVGDVRIPPGSEARGVFAVDSLQSGKPLQIDVAVGDDIHRFSFVPQ